MQHRWMSKRLQRAIGTTLAVSLVVLGSVVTVTAQVAVDPGLKAYEKVSGVSGNLNSIGSDTLNNLMTLWAEAFRALYPNVNIQIEGKGSSTAPPALIEGTAQLGPMSREMKATELDAFEKKYGYKPTEIKVAIDALGVFVHKDNPIKGLTLEQVDSMFSSTNKRGGKPINTWGELGLTGAWAKRAISLYGRNSASGTYGFFKEHVLKGRDFAARAQTMPGTAAVLQAVAKDKNGIGYGGAAYGVGAKNLLVKPDATSAGVDPTEENVLSHKYPIWRYLYIYVNPALDKGATAAYVNWIRSDEGQARVKDVGYFPLPANLRTR